MDDFQEKGNIFKKKYLQCKKLEQRRLDRKMKHFTHTTILKKQKQLQLAHFSPKIQNLLTGIFFIVHKKEASKSL